MTTMSERQRERFDEIDIIVEWFGFLPSTLFLTFLMVLLVVSLGGYLFIVDLSPLISAVVAVVTAFSGALLLSVRWISRRVISSGGRTGSHDAGTAADFLSTIFGIPTWFLGTVLLLVWLVQPVVVFEQIGSVPAAGFVAVEGIIALVLGAVTAVQATLKAITASGGEIPDGLNGRLWRVRAEAMTPSLTTERNVDDSES